MSHDAISEWVEAAHAAWLRTGDEKTLRRSLLELLQYLELNELLKAQFSLRMQIATQQLTNTSQLKKVRRDIARVKTVMNQKDAK